MHFKAAATMPPPMRVPAAVVMTSVGGKTSRAGHPRERVVWVLKVNTNVVVDLWILGAEQKCIASSVKKVARKRCSKTP